jgi:hypothetical protein
MPTGSRAKVSTLVSEARDGYARASLTLFLSRSFSSDTPAREKLAKFKKWETTFAGLKSRWMFDVIIS